MRGPPSSSLSLLSLSPPSSLFISAFSSSSRVGSSLNAAAKGASILTRLTRILLLRLTAGRGTNTSSPSLPYFFCCSRSFQFTQLDIHIFLVSNYCVCVRQKKISLSPLQVDFDSARSDGNGRKRRVSGSSLCAAADLWLNSCIIHFYAPVSVVPTCRSCFSHCFLSGPGRGAARTP